MCRGGRGAARRWARCCFVSRQICGLAMPLMLLGSGLVIVFSRIAQWLPQRMVGVPSAGLAAAAHFRLDSAGHRHIVTRDGNWLRK